MLSSTLKLVLEREAPLRQAIGWRFLNVLLIRVCRVKFGAFYEYLDREHRHQFDRVASGHYARVLRDASIAREQSPWASAAAGRRAGVTRLALTADAVKDQTYFLAQLTQVKARALNALAHPPCFSMTVLVLRSPCSSLTLYTLSSPAMTPPVAWMLHVA